MLCGNRIFSIEYSRSCDFVLWFFIPNSRHSIIFEEQRAKNSHHDKNVYHSFSTTALLNHTVFLIEFAKTTLSRPYWRRHWKRTLSTSFSVHSKFRIFTLKQRPWQNDFRQIHSINTSDILQNLPTFNLLYQY